MKVGIINAPRKVGRLSWARCWRIMAKRTTIFGVNETLSPAAKATYGALAAASGWGHGGLRDSPNPVFYKRARWRKTYSRVRRIHGPAPAENRLAREFPGFNAARYITEVHLQRRRQKNGRTVVVLCTHLVPNGGKVEAQWRDVVRAMSLDQLRAIVKYNLAAGHEVWVIGDMNIHEYIRIPDLTWIKGRGIDKIGVAGGDYDVTGFVEVPAPTDHKHGYVATATVSGTLKP